jgi:hypothetical protein
MGEKWKKVTDIKSTQVPLETREYWWPDGIAYTATNIVSGALGENGEHILKDKDGTSHVVKGDWRIMRFAKQSSAPKEVTEDTSA